jgi:hypothetical protein
MVGVKTMWILVYLLKEQGRQAQAQAQVLLFFFLWDFGNKNYPFVDN